VPTSHPRYTVTDTGDLREMLDLAARRWPHITDRRRLLLALAAEGREAIAPDVDPLVRAQRRERQQQALSRAAGLLDEELLLTDAAWR
jgi:hypothetical protein